MNKLDLQALILELRPDLQARFGKRANSEEFRAWLAAQGLLEYDALLEDASFAEALRGEDPAFPYILTRLQGLVWKARPDLQAAFPLPRYYKNFLEWFYTYGVEEGRLWTVLSDAEKDRVRAQPEPWRTRLKKAIRTRPESSSLSLQQREWGVNVIGYAYGQLGIGEDLRMAARSLLAAEVPVTIIDFPPGPGISVKERSMAAHVSKKGDYAVNLFCLTAEELGRFYAERGGAQFRNRYSIGYWPWELGQWPKPWRQMLALVDEVWVATEHIRAALAPVCDKPLLVMPMAVELEKVRKFRSRAQARKHFGLPEAATLFCFAFDLQSHLARKNPQGCIDAFQRAFPPQATLDPGLRRGDERAPSSFRRKPESSINHEVGLVIKVSNVSTSSDAWEHLKTQAGLDPRIHIIEGNFPRAELLALYQACDCFLSLHRAEGFGRGLAEALQLGLHVICTGYSGNVDFCRPPHAELVKYKLVKVRKDEYVHTQGQVWAEPDLGHAAMLMRQFATGPSLRRKSGWPEFSVQTVGRRYRKRLWVIRKGLK